MDYITIHIETGLLICKECKFALIPSRIDSHYSGTPHHLTPTIRSQIKTYISSLDISNLITTESQISSTLSNFLKSFNLISFIPEIAIYYDGLGCLNCLYISRSRRPIQNHLKENHDWENPRIRGRKKRLHENNPWQINVPCQQFFKSGPGKEYFRVNTTRVSPTSISTRPRIEISRERELSSSESDEISEDLDRLRPISQGTYYIYFILLYILIYI